MLKSHGDLVLTRHTGDGSLPEGSIAQVSAMDPRTIGHPSGACLTLWVLKREMSLRRQGAVSTATCGSRAISTLPPTCSRFSRKAANDVRRLSVVSTL